MLKQIKKPGILDDNETSLKDILKAKEAQIKTKIITVKMCSPQSCGEGCGCYPDDEFTLEVPEDYELNDGDYIDDFDIVEQFEKN